LNLGSPIQKSFFEKSSFVLSIIIILFAINNVSFSQGRRDRIGGNVNYKVNQQDTSKGIIQDSLLAQDSTKLLPIDSTARIKYFKYAPEYSYGTSIKGRTSPFLLSGSALIAQKVEFDQNGNVVVTESFDGEPIRAPLVLPLAGYLSTVTDKNKNRAFSEIVAERFRGNTQDDLSKLFEKFTDITIPLPFKSESIFGPPTFNLKINGAVDITASYQANTTDQTNLSGFGNSNNSINFKQEVQLTAKGRVGDKLNIDADYNTQRLFDFENQLKLRYDGYPDEVIKKIEGGNVSLETRSGLIGSSQALFGVKGDFQLGALALSTVLSQKKSKTEVKDFSFGAQEQPYTIQVWDYSDNHYFLDTTYKQSFVDYFNNSILSSRTDSLQIDDLTFEVWVQADVTFSGYREAGLHVDLEKLPQSGKYNDSLKVVPTPIQGLRSYGIVRKLANTEYTLNKYAGFVSLKISLPENYFVGVAYRRTVTGEQYGTISSDSGANGNDTLVLKMIKVDNLTPANTLAWEHKLKNIYRLPVSRVAREGFEFDVKFQDNGVYNPTFPPALQINSNLITILGLDKYSIGRTGTPDNKFDYIPGLTIDPENGFVIFPTLKPFLTVLQDYNVNGRTIDSSYWYRDIYTDLKSNSRQKPNGTNYRIDGKARGEAAVSNTINLGFNIVQGSVSIKVGNIELAPNIDYTVDYTTGTVVIRNTAALLSKDLKVSYETNDLFTLASKTFIGLRGDYRISEKSSIGFTFVNLKQETLNDKVRIGEEPTNNSMFGVDIQTEIPANFLTGLVNLLPGYNTRQASTISLRGELAAIAPDPNTKKSEIPDDNNEAVAYIDDMEGSKKLISLGGTYNSWTMASVPLDESIGPRDSLNLKFAKKGKLKWYNIPNGDLLTNIYPNKDVQTTQNTITPLYITYDPSRRGNYNYNGSFDSIPDKSTTWNGVMKFLNTTSNDLVNENINFIEFNMRIENLNNVTRNGKLVIDLGSISQDAIPNLRLDTEDSLKNGELRLQDDLGIDYLTDQQELEVYNQLNGTSLTLQQLPDPALDNNNPNGIFGVETINGTQNNIQFEGGRRPDTEDLNRNNNVRNPNDYFQFEISLDTLNNPYIVGTGKDGWHQYKIPLSEYVSQYGNAVFTNVQFARMWMTGLTDTVRLNLYDINLTGNQWVKSNKFDTTYNITTVSIEENSQIYQSPVAGDILRQTIRGQNNVDTKSNEASLAIQVSNLTSGVRKTARKDFNSVPLDMFNYRSMKLFVNGDPSFNYTSDQVYDATMIIRFGNDSNNYYEYRAPVHPDSRPGQPWDSLNNVTINFADLTRIKLARDSANIPVSVPVTNGPPGAEYRVFGNPDLKSIREIILGVEKNRTALNSAISGSVWFNELRLVNVIDNEGIAFNFNANVKIADLMDLNFAMARTDPYFHSIDGRFGTRNTGQSWDFSATLYADRLLNNFFSSVFSENWGNFLTLPITFRHNESLIQPQYFPGTDVELDKAAEQKYLSVLAQTGDPEQAQIASDNVKTEAQTLIVRNNIAVNNMGFNFPSNFFLVKNIINGLRFNFNADFGGSRDVTYENKNDFRYNGGVSFATDFGLADLLHLNIGSLLPLGERYAGAKLYFCLPFIPLAPLFSKSFSASTDFNRSQAESKQRKFAQQDLPSRQFIANRGFRFDWKFIENWIIDLNGSYDFRAGSDLTDLETYNDSIRSQRPENEIFNDIFFNNGFVNFGEDLDYSQNVSFNPAFNFPWIDRFISITGNYNVRYGWVNPNQISNVGSNIGYSSTVNASAIFKLNELFSLFTGSGSGRLSAMGMRRDSVPQEQGNKQTIANIFKAIVTLVPKDISMTFTQTNTVSNGGVGGLPGFGNFWFYPTSKDEYGPSRMYQLGFSLDPGPRAPNLSQISDNYTSGNEVSLTSTINPLFPESVTMSLTFRKAWGFTNNLFYTSDALGIVGSPTSKTSSLFTGNSIFFGGDVSSFSFDYDPNNSAQNRRNITDAFRSQISSFPFPNWNLSISGLEKFPLFAQFANSVTLENAFISEYKESRSVDINSYDIPNAQSVTQAFSPLIGMNINFRDVLAGSLTAALRLSSGTVNNLNPIGASIQTVKTSEWSLNMNFTKTGFSIPLFGLSLQNDISFALTLSRTNNEPILYEYATGLAREVPGNGSRITQVNPSIQYSLSSKVTMQLFYKYIKTNPLGQTVTTIPRTTNEGGLNIRIAIQ
jgi:hypothetical protein